MDSRDTPLSTPLSTPMSSSSAYTDGSRTPLRDNDDGFSDNDNEKDDHRSSSSSSKNNTKESYTGPGTLVEDDDAELLLARRRGARRTNKKGEEEEGSDDEEFDRSFYLDDDGPIGDAGKNNVLYVAQYIVHMGKHLTCISTTMKTCLFKPISSRRKVLGSC
jgi:hypothetical protein